MNDPRNSNPFTPKTQKESIIEHLRKHGSLTRLEAIDYLGIIELPARICDLEKEGFVIPRETYQGTARNGRTYKSKRYLTPSKWA